MANLDYNKLMALLPDGPAKSRLANKQGMAGKYLVRVVIGQEDGRDLTSLRKTDGKGMAKGEFTGRAGTIKRSRKGNVTRALNGSRTYIPEDNWWDENAPKVVAY